MKTQNEIEQDVCAKVRRFEQEHLGRGPRTVECYLERDLLVIRLQDILTAAEQQLARSLSAQAGRDVLRQLRTQLIEISRPIIEEMIERSTGVRVASLHHDINTLTSEEVFTIFLATAPLAGETTPA